MIRIIAGLIALLASAPAFGWIHGQAVSQSVTGITLQNVQFGQGYPYLNAFKGAKSFNWNSPATPASMNRNGYPANTGSLGGAITFVASINPNYAASAGKYHVSFGTGAGAIQGNGGNVANVVPTGDCSGVTINSASGLTISGTSTTGCDVAFNFTATTIASPIAFAFPAGFAYSNMAGAYFVQDVSGSGLYNNYALFQNGKEFDPDFKDFFASSAGTLKSTGFLNPGWLRGMDAFTTNSTNVVDYKYKPLRFTSFFYDVDGSWYPPNLWSGTTTGTGSNLDPYTVNYADDPGAWTDGETFSFTVPSTLASHAVTGTVNNGGTISLCMASTSGFTNGVEITVTSVGGTTSANTGQVVSSSITNTASWVVSNVQASNAGCPGSSPSVDLTGSAFNSAWTSGGNALVTPYIRVGARTAKIALGNAGGGYTSATGSSGLQSGMAVTAVYNTDADRLFTWHAGTGSSPSNYLSSGITYGMPYDVWTSFCVELNKNCWYNLPTLISDSAVTEICTSAAQNLPTQITAAFEVSNEQWNTSFTQIGLTQNIGYARGYPVVNGSNAAVSNTWYANRGAQVAALCKAAWQAAGRNLSTLNNVIGIQGVPVVSTDTQRMQGVLVGARTPITNMTNVGTTVTITAAGTWTIGQQVGVAGQTNNNANARSACPSISGLAPFNYATTSGAPTNPIYTITAGGTGSFQITQTGVSGAYTSGGCVWLVPQAPNRFVDNAQVLSYAPYYSGGSMPGPDDNQYSSTTRVAGAICAGCATSQAYNYVNGNPTQQAAALAWIDNDVRQGIGVSYAVSSVSGTTWTTSTAPTTFSFNSPILATPGSGGVLPTPFAANTPYFSNTPSGSTFTLGTPTGSSAVTATNSGTLPFSVGVLGNIRQLTMLNMAAGSISPTGNGWYSYWGSLATTYNLKLISYEGGYEVWVPRGSVLTSFGDTYNPPNSYGGNQAVSSISNVDGTVTTSAAHNLAVGNAVGFASTVGSGTSAIYPYLPYYVVNVGSSTTFKVAKTQGGSVVIPSSLGGSNSMSQDVGNMLALLAAYKNSSLFKQVVLDQFSQQLAVSPVGSVPAWYGDIGSVSNTTGTAPSPWALSPSDELATPYFQSYYAICQYNGGGC